MAHHIKKYFLTQNVHKYGHIFRYINKNIQPNVISINPEILWVHLSSFINIAPVSNFLFFWPHIHTIEVPTKTRDQTRPNVTWHYGTNTWPTWDYYVTNKWPNTFQYERKQRKLEMYSSEHNIVPVPLRIYPVLLG